MIVDVAIEGLTDLPVIRKVLAATGCELRNVYGQSGKGHLMKNLGGYNSAAQFSPWLVVRDLDQDDHCAPALVTKTLPAPSEWMRYRIAVKETEAWLLADAEAISAYLRVKRSLVTSEPDVLPDPKQHLVNLARRSTTASIRSDLVPAAGTSGVVGPGYSSRIADFVENHWRLEVAQEHSLSLKRCVQRVTELAAYGR